MPLSAPQQAQISFIPVFFILEISLGARSKVERREHNKRHETLGTLLN